jgi:phosphoribosyl-ATP pyrophosphohydrolase
MTDRTLGTQLDLLWATIEQRRSGDPSKSYTAQLLSQGVAKAADKVTEEAAEAVAEARKGDGPLLAQETADLFYHVLVLLAACKVSPTEVAAALQSRTGQSGLEEKASRS